MAEAGSLSPWVVALSGLGAVLVAGFALWLVSLRLRDASIVDPFWAPAFLLVGGTYAAVWGDPGLRGWVVLALVALWAGRLGWHLLRRNRREGEDRRYQAMRAGHGEAFGRVSLFTVFWLQAMLVWVISMPLFTAVVGDQAWGWLDGLGTGTALLGIVVEGIADAQLEAFKRRPENAGRVLDTGLWRYSRHPNYFGNAVLWWGLYLVGWGGGGAWTVFSPVIMTFLLLKVSGVTLLERDIGARRPDYQAYVDRTSAFVPWPPRRG